jgi:predicted secreted hydrolase
MDVAAVGGDVQHWIFVVQSRSNEGQLHLARIPDEPFDTRADIWTDPQRGQWPVRVELKEPRGDPLVLRLTCWQPVGP